MRRILLIVCVSIVASALLTAAAAAATRPAVVGTVSNSTSLSGTTTVAVSGNYAFAVSYWSGQLNVIDISTPTTPTLVASTPSTPTTVPGLLDATNITIAGAYAFVTSKNRNGPCTPGPAPSCAGGSNDDGTGNSLTVVDISNPLSPTVVGTVHSGTELFGAYAVAVSGHYAFVASQGLLGGQPSAPDTSTGSFSVIDLNNVAGGVVANIDNSSLATNALDHATSVAISGNYAYVTPFLGGRLTVIDIANPTSPTVVASHRDPTNFPLPNDVATQGNYAYVVNQVAAGPQLAVVDISNPLAPTVIGSLTNPALSGAYRVRVRGNFVYLSANTPGDVAAVDVSNPSAPRLAGVATGSQLANVDGLAVSSTGRYVIATAPRLPTGHAPANFPPYPFQPGGVTVTGIVSVVDLEPLPLSVSIAPASKPANPTLQNSANFRFAVSDAVTTVKCSLDNAAPGQCTTSTTGTYGALGLGTHTFTVTATDATGATAQDTYTWTIANSSPPGNITAPKISGIAQQGRKLNAANGAWSGSPTPTYGYQWQRCNTKGQRCKSISKQTKNAYKVSAADVGSRLNVVVKATNSAGSATATSATTKIVTWSSSAFARATLTRSKTPRPGISLSIPAVGDNLKLKKLVISLPKGISFTATKSALAAGTSAKDLRRKRLAFTVTLSRGKFTLTFRKPPTGLRLTVAAGLVSISSTLQHRIKSRKAKSETLSLSLNYAGKPVRRGAVKSRLT